MDSRLGKLSKESINSQLVDDMLIRVDRSLHEIVKEQKDVIETTRSCRNTKDIAK